MPKSEIVFQTYFNSFWIEQIYIWALVVLITSCYLRKGTFWNFTALKM